MRAADRFLEHLGMLTEMNLFDDKVFVAVFLATGEFTFSDDISRSDTKVIEKWLRNEGVELADGVFDIHLPSGRIFVFDKIEDDAGIVLTGRCIKRNIKNSISLLEVQQRHLFNQVPA